MPDTPSAFGRRKLSQRSGGSAHLRDHTRAYRRLRGSLLDQEPLCRYCLANGRVTAATMIDHILALSLGGTNGPENLAPACTPCNAEKAKAEQAYLSRHLHPADIMGDPALAGWIRRLQPSR